MTTQGIEVRSERVRYLEPLLKEWLTAIDEYGLVTGDDLAYWHNERANISVFTGAVWRARGVAIEEFGSRKHNLEWGDWTGRSDLRFHFAGKSWLVEAKQQWVCLSSAHRTQAPDKAAVALAEAVTDVSSNRAPADMRLGLAFVTPWIRRSQTSDAPVAADELLRAVTKKDGLDLIAWSFPNLDARLIATDNSVCIGVILLGRLFTGPED